MVAKILFATNRARPDSCTTILFLITIMKEPDNGIWAKLVFLMKYIRGTRNLPLIMITNVNGIQKLWIDRSLLVHPKKRGQNGGGLSMGRGFPILSSTNQNLNTQSSTETENIEVDDYIPAII